MKHLTLAFALALSILAVNPAMAQAEEVVEKDIVVRVGGDDATPSADVDATENFIAAVRDLAGEKVADRFAEELGELNPEQRARLKEKLADGELSTVSINGGGIGAAEATIAILAISLSLGMPILIVLLVLYFSYRKRRQRMDLIRSFVDAGKEVPEQLLDEQSSSNPLRSGLSLVAVGLGISVAFAVMGNIEVSALGLIPMFLGIARLIYFYTEQKRPS